MAQQQHVNRSGGPMRFAGTFIIVLSLLVVTGGWKDWADPLNALKLGLIYWTVFAAGAYYYYSRATDTDYRAGNLCATVAVCAVPVIVHSVMRYQGWLIMAALRSWHPFGGDDWMNLHGYVVPVALATIAASVTACRLSPAPQPLMTVPHVIALSAVGIELARLYRLRLEPDIDDALVWGLFVVSYAAGVERAWQRTDYARYFYVMGALHVWYAMSYKWLVHQAFPNVVYALINVAYVVVYSTTVFRRRVFQVLGLLGLALYVQHEARRLDAVSFAACTAVLGAAMIVAGDHIAWLYRRLFSFSE